MTLTLGSDIAPSPYANYYEVLEAALYSTSEDLIGAVKEVSATSPGFISQKTLEDYAKGLKFRCKVRGPLVGSQRWVDAVFHGTGHHALTLNIDGGGGATRYIRASLVEESELGACKIDPEDAPGMHFYPRWGEVWLSGQAMPRIYDQSQWARDFVMQRIHLAPMLAAIDVPVDHGGRPTLGTRCAVILWLPILLDTLSTPLEANNTSCIPARVLHPTGPGDRYGIDARLVYAVWEHLWHPEVYNLLSWLVSGDHPQEFLFQPSAEHVAFAKANMVMPELVRRRFDAPRGISATPDDPWHWINIYRC